MVLTMGVMTLAWWGAAVAAPAMLAARALRRAKWAMKLHEYNRAERLLQRAAERADLREEALCLMAESALHAGRPADAMVALDGLFEEDSAGIRWSRRATLLRGVACSVMGQGTVAQQELAEIADRQDAAAEEQLAMAQASLQAGDIDAARVFLGMIHERELAGPLLARFKLTQAAVHWREGRRADAVAALPPLQDCTSQDRDVVRMLRRIAGQQAPAA